MCRLGEANGWVLKRISGSHHVYSKTGQRKIQVEFMLLAPARPAIPAWPPPTAPYSCPLQDAPHGTLEILPRLPFPLQLFPALIG